MVSLLLHPDDERRTVLCDRKHHHGHTMQSVAEVQSVPTWNRQTHHRKHIPGMGPSQNEGCLGPPRYCAFRCSVPSRCCVSDCLLLQRDPAADTISVFSLCTAERIAAGHVRGTRGCATRRGACRMLNEKRETTF